MSTWNADDPISHQTEASATGTAAGNINAYGGLTQRARGLVLNGYMQGLSGSVRLVKADEIVMHDGVRVSGWAGQSAFIGTSGANGYLGGVNAIGWYRIVALRRGANGTVSGVAQGTKALGLAFTGSYVNETGAGYTSGHDNVYGLRVGATTQVQLAQGFRVSTSAPQVHAVRLLLTRNGTPTGAIQAAIHTDASGAPSGTVLALSDPLVCNNISALSTYHWVTLVFRTPVTLASGTQYHLVLSGDYAISAVNYIAWRMDATSPTYADGSVSTSNGTTWAAQPTQDFMFEVIKKDTSVDIATNLPAGYDQYAELGWVFWNGSITSPFRQFDNRWVPDDYHSFGIVTPTVANQVDYWDLSSFVPPIPLRLELVQNQASATSAYVWGVGAHAVGYWAGSGAQRRGGGMAQVAVNAGGGHANPVIDILTEYQRIYTELPALQAVGLQLTAFEF